MQTQRSMAGPYEALDKSVIADIRALLSTFAETLV